jgi:branched-chain amino acid transport system substrate-binding protein
MTHSTSRRTLLTGLGVGAALATLPAPFVHAQAAPIRLGTLTPLTGSGGNYGPTMRDAVAAVIEQVNAVGGVLGRRITLVSEDDQTNPEAAVAPLCWESKTFLATVSGADSITLLPHQGYLIRTQPNTELQGRKYGEFALELGAKNVYTLMPQTPFTQSLTDSLGKTLATKGATHALEVYDAKKTSYRSEVDQAMRQQPDTLFLGGYSVDTAVLLRDIYRAGFKGKMLTPTYAVDGKLLESVPAEATEGIYALGPSPAINATAYKAVLALLKKDTLDPYSAQVYDHINLIVLALAKAGEASGTAIRDAVRKISQGGGTPVDNALDGLKLLAQGKDVNYEGASGPCDFDAKGDVLSVTFKYEQVRAGKLVFVKAA